MTALKASPAARARRGFIHLTPVARRRAIDYMAWFLLALLVVIGFALKGSLFFSPDNLTNIVEQSAIIGVLAIGQFVVVLTGGIDLSVGSVMALMAMIAGVTMPLGTFGSTGVTLAAGAAVGVVSGLVIVFGGLPPFITTFAMMAVCRGLALTITSGESVSAIGSPLTAFGYGPRHWAVWLACVAIIWYLLSRTRLGVHVYAAGGNLEAARVSGINTRGVIILVYVIAGVCGAIAGLLSLARNGVAMPTSGVGYEMQTIAAVVLGGINLFGGEGRFSGAVAGVVFVVMLRNILDASNADPFWSFCVIGAVLWLAVVLRGVLERIR
jgi:ribose transport system permease protein